eukprot:1333964-Amorphochlora_amoeboformis.AAC.1
MYIHLIFTSHTIHLPSRSSTSCDTSPRHSSTLSSFELPITGYVDKKELAAFFRRSAPRKITSDSAALKAQEFFSMATAKW